MSRTMRIYEPGDTFGTINGDGVVYTWTVNEHAMVVEQDQRQRRIEEAMGIEARQSAGDVRLDLLRNVYSLLGDGDGDEWDENPEYTRGLLEVVRDMFTLDDREAAENLLRQTIEIAI